MARGSRRERRGGVGRYRSGTRRIRSLEQAAAFVDEAGVAVFWSSADLVLPSLWEAVAGAPDADWAVRDEHGKATGFTPEFAAVWRWKDELPERRLAIAGRHLGRFAVLVSPRLASCLRASAPDGEPEGLEREVAEAIAAQGPASAPELRRLLGAQKKPLERAIAGLHRRRSSGRAGVDDADAGWPAIRHDLFERHWRRQLRRLPAAAEARSRLASCVLRGAGEVSAADVAAALGWKRRDAAAVLDDLEGAGEARAHDAGGLRLWRPAGGRGGRA